MWLCNVVQHCGRNHIAYKVQGVTGCNRASTCQHPSALQHTRPHLAPRLQVLELLVLVQPAKRGTHRQAVRLAKPACEQDGKCSWVSSCELVLEPWQDVCAGRVERAPRCTP